MKFNSSTRRSNMYKNNAHPLIKITYWWGSPLIVWLVIRLFICVQNVFFNFGNVYLILRNQTWQQAMTKQRPTKLAGPSWSCWKRSWRKKIESSPKKRKSWLPRRHSSRPRSRSSLSRKQPWRHYRLSWRGTPTWSLSSRASKQWTAQHQRFVSCIHYLSHLLESCLGTEIMMI